MGSTGSGNFSDYSQNTSAGTNQGGTSGQDNCMKAYSLILEDANRCEYYANHGTLPPNGTAIMIVLNTRLVAVTQSNEVIGYLPTSYNFLAACMRNGFSYGGQVISTRMLPTMNVTIDIAPL